MDKNTFIVLGFLLLCLYLSLPLKEGYVIIERSEFEEQCNVDNQCIVTQSGASGFICNENVHSTDYNIEGNDGSNIFSDPFNLSLGDSPCNLDNADLDSSVTPSILPCTEENSPYLLTGCLSKCSKPIDSPIYNLDRAPQKISNNPDPTSNQNITCNDGFAPAKNICFDKNTGAINPNKNQGTCQADGGIWYDSSDQAVKTFCPAPGTDYVMMGCEPECLSRISNSDDYLMTTFDGSTATPEGSYLMGKELMEITPQRDSQGPGDIVPITTSPYNVDESGSSLDPNNFNVIINPLAGNTNTGVSIPFEGNGLSETCNINSDNMDTRDKYYVKGLFPTCGQEDQPTECLNFNISYDSVTSNDEKPYNLEQLRNRLPTNIFQDGTLPADIQKYKDSLYYFRGFMGSNGDYNVEGQIRCDTDPTSRYHCTILNGLIPDEGLGQLNEAAAERGLDLIQSEGNYTHIDNRLCRWQSPMPDFYQNADITIESARGICHDSPECLGFEVAADDEWITLFNRRDGTVAMIEEEGAKCYLHKQR